MEYGETSICQVCLQSRDEMVSAALISVPMGTFIKTRLPTWSDDGFICSNDLNKFRILYVEDTILKDKGALTKIEQDIVDSFKEQELISKNLFNEFDTNRSFANRLADKVATFGGSWAFILSFLAVLVTWIVFNSISFVHKRFDPYPYILLNLLLSCIAAIQAPIIMMSQGRIESRDRLRSELDYQTNTKAEIEVKNLHEKMDHLVINQWQRLLEIQQFQIELLQELIEQKKKTTLN